MKKLVLILIIAFGAYHWYTQEQPGFTGQVHERVIMYSLTTCGFCDQKRQELTEARIHFTEYFIDQDVKLQKAGIPPQSVGTPSFDVHGHMLINNPPMKTIREHMSPGRKKV